MAKIGEFTVEYMLRHSKDMNKIKLMTLSDVYDFMKCNRILCSHMRLISKPVYRGNRAYLKPIRTMPEGYVFNPFTSGEPVTTAQQIF